MPNAYKDGNLFLELLKESSIEDADEEVPIKQPTMLKTTQDNQKQRMIIQALPVVFNWEASTMKRFCRFKWDKYICI